MYTSTPIVRLAPEIAQGISALLFIAYGLSCFLSKEMIVEFDRYLLTNLRVLTGVLQITGGFGLIVGYFNRPILLFSATGLTVMMFLALVTRYRIRDSIAAALPAFSLFALNAYLVFAWFDVR